MSHPHRIVTLPQFPNDNVYIGYYSNITPDTLATVKNELIGANPEYDFCFLNTDIIVSLEHLLSSVYRSLLEWHNGTMKTKTFNTLILYNLSASNNVGDALRRFGVDVSCPRVVVIKLLAKDDNPDAITSHLLKLLQTDECLPYTDETIWSIVDLAKLKKTYKLTDAQIKDTNAQAKLTRLTIAAGLLRGC